MHVVQRLARSILRIALGVTIAGAVLFSALVVVLRQPVLTALPFAESKRTDSAALKKHCCAW